MTDDERHSLISEAAEKAAHNAVVRLFEVLGVDIDDKDQIQELRKDFNHARSWRKRMELIGETATATATKYVVIAVIGIVAIGTSEKIRHTVINEVPQQVGQVVGDLVE